MPERSDWLLAGGGAKRNPRYRGSHHDASERREYRLPRRLLSRLSDAFLYGACIPGVALTLNPRLRALGLRPRYSTLQVGYLRCHDDRRTASADNHMLMIKSHTDFTDIYSLLHGCAILADNHQITASG